MQILHDELQLPAAAIAGPAALHSAAMRSTPVNPHGNDDTIP